jgi:hypothetical protein
VADFDLGDDLLVREPVALAPPAAWALSRDLLAGYERIGCAVRFTEEAPPSRVAAEVLDPKGTRIHATVDVGDGAIAIRIEGSVRVDGLVAALATPEAVRRETADRVRALLRRAIHERPAPAPAATSDLERRLATLAALRAKGLIDDAELRAKRRQIIDEFVG